MRKGPILIVSAFLFVLALIPFLTKSQSGDPAVGLRLIKNDVSLTHACSYYEIDLGALREEYSKSPYTFFYDLYTLNISRIKEVAGKLKDVRIEIEANETYKVNVTDYAPCLMNYTVNGTFVFNETDGRYWHVFENYSYPADCVNVYSVNKTNDTCEYNTTCVSGWHFEKKWRNVWVPIWKWNRVRSERWRVRLGEFSRYLLPTLQKIHREKVLRIRVCGNYQFERTDNGWGVSIDHIPYFLGNEYARFTWWNSSWKYRKPITITEQSGNTLTDYQVKLTIDTASLISEEKMNSDCSDIRFTWYNESSGEEVEIPYWIESGCNSANTVIWVKVPEIPANDNATIYMYYGNPSATSESNATAVFNFFEDFEGTSLPSGWTLRKSATYTVSNSILIVTGTSDTEWGHVAYTTGFSYGQVYEMRIKVDADSGYFDFGLDDRAMTGNVIGSGLDTADIPEPAVYGSVFRNLREHSITTAPRSLAVDTWRIYTIKWLSDRVIHELDYGADSQTITSNVPLDDMSFIFWVKGNGKTIYADWVRIREFADPEPTYSIGSEESATGNQPPQITIYSPLEQTYHTNDINLIFKIIDDNSTVFHVKAWLDDNLQYDNYSYINNTEITINLKQYINTTGTHYVKVWANDTNPEFPLTSSRTVYFTVDNLPPSVEEPKTYDENYEEKTTFEPGDNVIIRVNVTDLQGAGDIDKVLISIIDNSSTIQVANETMVKVGAVTGSASWWDTSFTKRKSIAITEQSGSTLTDYQVALNISYESEMQSDFDDLRFTYYNETSGEEIEIPYWIEQKVDGNWAYVWVKVPQIPANGETTIYMYYGNPEASSESNADNVFVLFDHFEGTELNTTKWDVMSSTGTYEISNSQFIAYPGTSGAMGIISKNTYNFEELAIEVRDAVDVDYYTNDYERTVVGVTNDNSYGMVPPNAYHAIWEYKYDDRATISKSDANRAETILQTVTGVPVPDSVFVRKTIVLHNGYQNFTAHGYFSIFASDTEFTYSNSYVFWQGYKSKAMLDWIAIRKYTDPEPTYSIGSEESVALTNTYEYNYTIPSDAVAGTWTIKIYANDTQNTWGYNSTTFEVISPITPPTITLNYPADQSTNTSLTIEFGFTPVADSEFLNCSLWTNESTVFALTEVNSTPIINGTINTITHTFTHDGTYVWNVKCYEADGGSAFASQNYTITIDHIPFIEGVRKYWTGDATHVSTSNTYYTIAYSTPLMYIDKALLGNYIIFAARLWNTEASGKSYVKVALEREGGGVTCSGEVGAVGTTKQLVHGLVNLTDCPDGMYELKVYMKADGGEAHNDLIDLWSIGGNMTTKYAAGTEETTTTTSTSYIRAYVRRWYMKGQDAFITVVRVYPNTSIKVGFTGCDVWATFNNTDTFPKIAYLTLDTSSCPTNTIDTWVLDMASLGGTAKVDYIDVYIKDNEGKFYYTGDDTELSTNSAYWITLKQTRVGESKELSGADTLEYTISLWNIGGGTTYGRVVFKGNSCNVVGPTHSTSSTTEQFFSGSLDISSCKDEVFELEIQVYASGGVAFQKYIDIYMYNSTVKYNDGACSKPYESPFDSPDCTINGNHAPMVVYSKAEDNYYSCGGQPVEVQVCDWDDDISSVVVETDGIQTSADSFTQVSDYCYVYSAVVDSPAGTHNVTWYITDSSGITNKYTDQFTIYKATPQLSLTSSPGWTVTYPTETTVTGSENNCGDDDLVYTLYRDGVPVSNPDTAVLGAGTHVYEFNTSGGQNYTSNSITQTLTVGKGTPGVYLYLNGTRGNVTYGFGTYANFTADTNTTYPVTLYLYSDYPGWVTQSGLSPLTNITYVEQLGTWNITAYFGGDENYTSAYETHFFTVQEITPPTITFVSQTPVNLTANSTEPVTIIMNITDNNGVNLSKVAFFVGVNHTSGPTFFHYNWSWRYPANDLQPDMRRADNRNMSYWFEDVVFKENPNDIWTFAGYDNTTYEFKVIDSGPNYYTINITFFSAQMMFPQVFPFDKMYLTAENKTDQYVELHKNSWMKIKFYPKVFHNYTHKNYTVYIDLNVDPSFTPNTKPLEIYFCNASYTAGDPLNSDNCVYIEDIDATDTRTIVINQSSYIQNVFYISNGYIDGVKVSDEAYLVLRTTVPAPKAFRLHYADDVINEFINFTDFKHAWISTDRGATWNMVSYTPDFYLIYTQAERDKVMYYAYACDIYDNCANSSIQYDSLDPVNHPPAEPLIIAPEENETVSGLYNVTWLTIGDPDFDPFNASIYLCNPDGSINATIADNIAGDNTQYEYRYQVDFSSFLPGDYRLNVTLCDAHGLCSSSLTSYIFYVTHTKIYIYSPLNQTYWYNVSNPQMLYNFSVIDPFFQTFYVKALLNGQILYENSSYESGTIVAFTNETPKGANNFTVLASTNAPVSKSTIFTVRQYANITIPLGIYTIELSLKGLEVEAFIESLVTSILSPRQVLKVIYQPLNYFEYIASTIFKQLHQPVSTTVSATKGAGKEFAEQPSVLPLLSPRLVLKHLSLPIQYNESTSFSIFKYISQLINVTLFQIKGYGKEFTEEPSVLPFLSPRVVLKHLPLPIQHNESITFSLFKQLNQSVSVLEEGSTVWVK